jgi:uncharacterized membrane protein YkoI
VESNYEQSYRISFNEYDMEFEALVDANTGELRAVNSK